MPRLPRITASSAERAILRDGWYLARTSSSSHRHYHHPTKAGRVTIAFHRGQIIKPRTLQAIIADAGLTVDQFRDLL